MEARHQYPQEKYRFVILIVYILAALVNSLPVHTFSSINVLIEDKFHISGTAVTMNALLFTIAHPLFAVPCNWIINRFGMHVSFVAASLLVSGGTWLRLLLEDGQAFYCLIGSFLAAVGNIFVLNTPSKVSMNWFSKDRAGIVTFTGILATLLSITLGASVPGLIIDDNTSIPEIKDFLFYQACIVTGPLLLLAIFFRDKPSQPPSKAASKILNEEKGNYKTILKKLFSNRQYLKLMVAMSLNYGTLTAMIMVLDQLLAGIGVSDSGQTTSITVGSAMVVGIISNPIFSFLLKSTKAYRAVTALNTFGGFFMTSLLILAFIYHIQAIGDIIFLSGMVGFFLIPLPSILISYGSEIVFPIDESSSTGYLLAASQTFGFLVGFASISFLNKTLERSEIVGFINMGLLLLSFVFAVWVKQDLKKMKFEESLYSQYKSEADLKSSLVVQQEINE